MSQPNVYFWSNNTQCLRQKRLGRSSALLRRLKVRDTKRVLFTDEKNFYLNPPISNQNNRIWSVGKKADVRPDRLIVEREKFALHVIVSAGVCFDGKGRLHFVDEKAKVNAYYYVGCLLPELIADCKRVLPAGPSFSKTAQQPILLFSRKTGSI